MRQGPLFAGIGHVSLKDSHERPPGRFSHKGSISKRATVLYGRGFPAMGLTTGRTRPTEATPSPRTQTVRKGGMQVQNRAQTRIFSCTLVKLLRVMTYEHKFKFFVIKKTFIYEGLFEATSYLARCRHFRLPCLIHRIFFGKNLVFTICFYICYRLENFIFICFFLLIAPLLVSLLLFKPFLLY